MKTIVHVNQYAIRKNKKTGSDDPVLTVKTYKSNEYAHDVVILGPSRVVYSPDKPLSCGARVWVETEAEVKIIGKKVARKSSEASCGVESSCNRRRPRPRRRSAS